MAYPFPKIEVDENSIPTRPKYEVADIFRLYGKEYRETHSLTPKQHSVMYDIAHCRSSGFGYHVDICDNCGKVEVEHNSCRNRHCPKCQGISRKKWVKARLKELLPVPYYHTVFTLPHKFFPLSLYNKELIYDLLFDSASETLLSFGEDKQWLGGKLGFYGILHSWGQTLWHHIHTHFIVPGGVLAEEGTWVEAEHGRKFLFPVQALSKVFMGKFIEGFKEAHCEGKINFPKGMEHLSQESYFEKWVDSLVSKKWVVYCKSPLSCAEDVVKYIGRYTHRVAISNYRIKSIADGEIRFSYKDYKDKENLWKEMQLKAEEFIQRFLWHVLPTGFHKIRHFGFLANGKKDKAIKQIRDILSFGDGELDVLTATEDECHEGYVCKVCRSGILVPVMIVQGVGDIIVRNFSLLIKLPGFNTT